MPLIAGDKLGPYEVLAPIGAGGMGVVYRARDPRLNRDVAIKVSAQQFSTRFEQEARAIAALNHPHICQIYDIGPDYLVLEFVEGQPIAGPLSVDEAVRLAIQIARALEEAHGRGILHRDLKPGNILVTAQGTSKLIDFGLAKLTVSGEDTTKTMDGAILGTVAYMAPEQAEGLPLDARSDIFSFGAVLYEMLSGKRAFRGESTVAILKSLLRDEPAPLDVPAELQRIVAKCLAKKPKDRFATVAEVRAALEQIDRHSDKRAPVSTATRTNVGREVQRAQMWRAYTRVKEGRGMILAITGEAGIGKTSLLEDFIAELGDRGERPVVGRGRCSQRLAGDEPYLPILEALESLLHPQSGPSFAGIMKQVAPTWYGLVGGDSVESLASGEAREKAPAASQERMKREFAALVQELSKSLPLVLFIDDLHWADISTIDILNYLAGRFSDTRVLVLGSYRPSDMALRGHPFMHIRNDLQSRGLFVEIAVPFLSTQDVVRYLELEFPGNKFPSDFASVIHAKTEGSPLFMADLVRYLHDTGGIVEEGGRWALARALPEHPRELPESVRGMIQRKIEQVEDRDKRLLAAASVEGHEFDSAVITEVVEMDALDVEERLEVLERINVFVRRGEEREFPDHSLTLNYQFVHVLYQNAMYDSLQPTRRAALCGKVAKALVARYGDQVPAVAARVAVLFETARDFSAAAQYFHIAAGRSVGLFAFREALALAERGLNALKSLPDSAAGNQQELVLQMMKGVALRSTSGWSTSQIEQVFARARQLVQILDDPPELIPVLWATTLFNLIRGNLVVCRDNADDLMRQAERSGNKAYLMAAHHVSGVVREFLGDMVESSRLLERCRELHLPSEHAAHVAMYGQDPGTTARAMSSRPLWALGYPDRAIERARETLGIARAEGHPTMISFALVVIQGIHLYRGEAAEAVKVGDEIAALCREFELPQEAVWSKGFQGYALHLLGRGEEGIEVLIDSLARQKALSAGLVRSAFLALLADALRGAGRVEEGLQAIEEGFAHAEQHSEGGYVAELHRVRGELLLLKGDAEQAKVSLHEAISYASRQQTKSFELRAATALARLLVAAGERDEARAVLAPVYGWFTEGNTTADLIGAQTLLSEIG
jgi:tRNA A-37 threonylcarbamoyl transferase component Bud32/tetratricopeptide (TPR) repeat protein/type II secretory pathway predicted ATPase ExeA